MTDSLFEPLTPASLTWGENNTPLSSHFNDVYFSSLSGIDETNHTFIEQNNLLERWQQTTTNGFTIGETGFGTGLNFLVAATHWLNTKPNGQLQFISTEKFPLGKTELEKIHQQWPEFAGLSAQLIQQWPPAVTGIHKLFFADNNIVLTLLLGDAQQQLSLLAASDHPQFQRMGNCSVNAWFLDGFAPSKNPDMWSPALFQAIANLSDAGTTFSSFTAAGAVRRGLQAVGFEVSKVAGFGNKREMSRGRFNAPQLPVTAEEDRLPNRFNSDYQPPWYLNRHGTPAVKTAVVIGGGIAGCSTANALAKRGIKVTLIERHDHLAGEGSGNLQGIIYPKLSAKASPLATFSLAALITACRFYLPFWNHHGEDVDQPFGQQCGVIVLPKTLKEADGFASLVKQFPQQLVQLLSDQQLTAIAGVTLQKPTGLFFPAAGWVKPQRVCEQLTKHPLIEVLSAEVGELQNHGHWRVIAHNSGNCIAEADSVIIATAAKANQFSQTSHLPLKPIRGQLSHLPTTLESAKLKTVICGSGYLAPSDGNNHTLGATYNLHETSSELRSADHQQNIEQIEQTAPGLSELLKGITSEQLDGRVAFRCTTPDYLPIAGAAPNYDAFLQDYALLTSNARAHIPVSGSYWPNLYINCGHGSRGLSYAPLCAELIASEITRQPAPLGRQLRQAIHPARFIIRQLKRGEIAVS